MLKKLANIDKIRRRRKDKRRNHLHEYYWSPTKDNQNISISHMVETITSVRPRKKTIRKKERRFTRIYHLENDKGRKVMVCQKMFLPTIGLSTDKTIGLCCQKGEVHEQIMYLIKGEKLHLQTKNMVRLQT